MTHSTESITLKNLQKFYLYKGTFVSALGLFWHRLPYSAQVRIFRRERSLVLREGLFLLCEEHLFLCEKPFFRALDLFSVRRGSFFCDLCLNVQHQGREGGYKNIGGLNFATNNPVTADEFSPGEDRLKLFNSISDRNFPGSSLPKTGSHFPKNSKRCRFPRNSHFTSGRKHFSIS